MPIARPLGLPIRNLVADVGRIVARPPLAIDRALREQQLGLGRIATDHGEREIERRGPHECGTGAQHARDQPRDECLARPPSNHLMIPTGKIFTTSDVLPQKRSRAR